MNLLNYIRGWFGRGTPPRAPEPKNLVEIFEDAPPRAVSTDRPTTGAFGRCRPANSRRHGCNKP
jgi:hypothetical protein